MGNSFDDQKTKIIPDRERIVPDKVKVLSSRLLREHIARYDFAAKFANGKVVADMACGSGYGALTLAAHGAKLVYAVDIDRQTIAYASNRYRHRNITYRQGDISEFKLKKESLDMVVSLETIEHLRFPKRFIGNIYPALKNSGIFIVSTPNLACSIEDNPYHYTEYTLDRFAKLLKPYFNRQIAFYGQRPVNPYVIGLYKKLKKAIPSFFHPLLKIRPWEKLHISPIDTMKNSNYLYFIAVCRKKAGK